MKLSHKLVLCLTAATTAGLVIAGTIWIEREAALIEGDARHDLSVMGRSLRPALVSTWRTEGRDRAFELLEFATERIGRRVHDLDIRWLDLNRAEAVADAGLSAAEVATIQAGHEVHRYVGDDEAVTLYLPVKADGLPPGALELSQSLARERGFLAESTRNVVVTIIALVLGVTIITIVSINWLVGGRLRRLAAQARSVGAGDFGVRVESRGADELGLVAGEMNAMCDHLVAARERIDAEHAAKISILEQLRHADRLSTVGTLAAGVAHELGTPLNVVLGRAKLIASGDDRDEAAREGARVIGDQTTKMVRIIRQLLDFARRPVSVRTRTDVLPIVRQTLHMLEPLAGKRGIELTLRTQESPGDAIVEPTELEQVITNIVTNGIQASAPGGSLTVSLRREHVDPPEEIPASEGDYLQIEVADQGEGIAPANLPHLFDPFFTTKPVGHGTGLGLSVAYGIVRDHGGWIDVQSELGRGSRFLINLPIADRHRGPERPVRANHQV